MLGINPIRRGCRKVLDVDYEPDKMPTVDRFAYANSRFTTTFGSLHRDKKWYCSGCEAG